MVQILRVLSMQAYKHTRHVSPQSHSSFDLFIDLDIKKSSVPRTKTGHFKVTSLSEENKVNIGKMIDKHQVISGLLLCKNYSGANFIIV